MTETTAPKFEDLPKFDNAKAHQQTIEEYSVCTPDLETRLASIEAAGKALYAIAENDDEQDALDLIANTIREAHHAIWIALGDYPGEPNIFALSCPTIYRSGPTVDELIKPVNGGDNV